MDIINVKKLDLSKIIIPSKIHILGNHYTSPYLNIIHEIINQHSYIRMSYGLVFCNRSNTIFYRQLLPNATILHDYDEKSLENCINKQRGQIISMSDKVTTFENCDWGNNVSFVIFNHIEDMPKDSRNLQMLFMNARTLRILFIVASCLPNLSVYFRNSIDYVFTFNSTMLRRLYQHYYNIFPTYEIFKSVFKVCTENQNECLGMSYRSSSNLIEDVLFWYETKPILHSLKAIAIEKIKSLYNIKNILSKLPQDLHEYFI